MTTPIEKHNLSLARGSSPVGPCEYGRPFYSWLSPSTYSPVREDMWCRGMTMPFEVVLMPGYVVPSSLNKDDIDSVWFDAEVNSPIVVWDGMGSMEMFEFISICMDPSNEMKEYIRVRDVEKGRYIRDPRPLWLVGNRPQKALSGSFLSYERKMSHSHYFKNVMPEFISNGLGQNGHWRGCAQHEFLYSRDRIREVSDLWGRWMMKHPDFSRTMMINAVAKSEPQVVDGLNFAYLRFEIELSSKESWFKDASAIDYLIKTNDGSIEGPLDIAKMKVSNGVPLTPEEEAIFAKRDELPPSRAERILMKARSLLKSGNF